MIPCEGCPLGGQQVFPSGPRNANLVVIGEAPGWTEVKRGKPFVGKSGQLLNKVLSHHGMDRSEVFCTNVTMCRNSDEEDKDVPPTKESVKSCSGRLESEIAEVKPKIILALGATSAHRILGIKEKMGNIAGALEYSEEFGCHVIPTYHPAAVLRGSQNFFDNIFTSVQRAVKFSRGEIPLPGKYHVEWEFIRDGARAVQVLTGLRSPVIAIDTESHGPDDQPRPMDHTWDMVQIYDGKKAYAFEVSCLGERGRKILSGLLQNPRITWIMHNMAYDQKVFKYNLGVTAKNVLDTMVLGLGLTERGEEVGLKALSRVYLNAPYYERGLKSSFVTGPQSEAEWESLAEYGCYDAYNTYHLGKVLPPLVREEGTLKMCRELLLPAQECFSSIPGTKVDLEYASGLEKEWVPIIEKSERELQEWAGSQGFPQSDSVVASQRTAIPCSCIPERVTLGPDRRKWRSECNSPLDGGGYADPSCPICRKRRYTFVPDKKLNVRSSKQLQHLAWDVLGMTGPGKRSCDKEFLEYNQGTEFASRLQDFRSKDFLLSHYVRGISECVWSDGRVHPDFLLFGTVTGRLAVHNPAIQTLPKWNVAPDLARSIRRMFIPSEGHVMVEADFNNLEVFTAHHYCKDPNLLSALTEYDFHQKTASVVFDKPYDQITGRERQDSKPVTFGVMFGRTAWALARGELAGITGGDERIAQRFIDNFWRAYPLFYAQYLEWQRQAVEDGEVVTTLGRKRRWRLITPENINHVKNSGSNFPIQSLASDICLSSLIRLNKKLPSRGLGNVCFPVHDSILAEVRKDRLEEGINLIVSEMTSPPFETETPFSVKVEVGPNLGEMVKYSYS